MQSYAKTMFFPTQHVLRVEEKEFVGLFSVRQKMPVILSWTAYCRGRCFVQDHAQASAVCARGAVRSHHLLHFTTVTLHVELLREDMDSHRWAYVPSLNHASGPSTAAHPAPMLQKRALTSASCSRLPTRRKCPSTQLHGEGNLRA